MIDSHAHLHFPAFESDRERVITRAFASGIAAIVEINVSAAGWPAARRLAAADPRIHASIGIHPHEAGPGAAGDLARLARELPCERVVAIGETGLDTVRGLASAEDQRALFVAHIGLARETDLPLVIHCRAAFEPLLALLDREGGGGVRGVFHCFSGDLAQAQAVIERGFRIGLVGSLTYDPARWEPVVRALPEGSLMLETDSPYLRPEPQRHARNEPACLWTTATAVARMRGVTVDALEAQTDRVTRELFGIGAHPAAGSAPACPSPAGPAPAAPDAGGA
jgi:TatD DNase family protein